MPTKRNKAGKQQNYIEAGHGDASGEYGDNATGSNKHFTQFKKSDDTGIQIKADGETSVQAKPKYDGKGGENISNVLTNKLKGANGKLTPNGKSLLEQIKGADDELSGVIGDYYIQNPSIEIKMGKNLGSCYTFAWGGLRKKIQLGNEAINTDGNYAKGGAFFHESGHALDYTFNGEHKTWSNNYKSEKYGKTMSEMIKEEIGQADYSEITKEWASVRMSFAEDEEYKKLRDRKNELNATLEKMDDEAYKNPEVIRLGKKKEELRKLKMDAWEKRDFDGMKKYQEEFDKTYAEYKVAYKNSFPSNYDELNSERDNIRTKLFKMQTEAQQKANRMYGDLSDMTQASLGKRFSMGHSDSYFKGKEADINRGTEAFAEIMSAKATNKESLDVLKKYIPKTLEIFDEIIGKVKGV